MAGFGPVLKKKDRVALALALAPQSGPSEADVLREQPVEVNQRLTTIERQLQKSQQEAATERCVAEKRWQASNRNFEELTEFLRDTFPTTFNLGRTANDASGSATRQPPMTDDIPDPDLDED